MSAENRRGNIRGRRKEISTATREVATEVAHKTDQILGGTAIGAFFTSAIFQKPELAGAGVVAGISAVAAHKIEKDRQQRVEDKDAYVREQEHKKSVIIYFWNKIEAEDANAGLKRNLYDYAIVPTDSLREYTFTQPADQDHAKNLMQVSADTVSVVGADAPVIMFEFNNATFNSKAVTVYLDGIQDEEVGMHRREFVDLEHKSILNPFDDVVEKVAIKYAGTKNEDGEEYRVIQHIDWSRKEVDGESEVLVNAWESRFPVGEGNVTTIYALSIDEIATLQSEILDKLPSQDKK